MHQSARLQTNPMEGLTLPQRFINPFMAYLAALIPSSPWVTVLQAVGAAAIAHWGQLEAVDRAFIIALGLDFVTGTGAAIRRHQFTLRACSDGAIAKVMTWLLVYAIREVAKSAPGWEWTYFFVAGMFALLNLMSTLRNFRRARIALPPGLERICAQIEATIRLQADNKVKSERGSE
jgi:hypothetical protein